MRQKVLLLLAIICGLLAFLLTYQQLEMEKRRIAGDAETAVLIKVNRDMNEGEEITEADVVRYEVSRKREEQMLSREIPYSDISMVIGRKLATAVSKNQTLQSTDLQLPTQRNGFNSVVRKDMRAISLPVDPVSSVNYLIQPNDNVDVIGTFRFPNSSADAELDTLTITILQDAKVLAVGNRWGSGAIDPYNNRNYGTITLQVYPDEVEMLIFASQKGSLSFSLRNYEDRSINTAIESRQVDFKMLKEEIRNYNTRRRMRRGL